MTTQEVAEKLVKHCQNNEYDQAYAMYADDAVSIEMEGMPGESITRGKKAILKGFEEWQKSIKEHHGGSIGEPVVAGNHFVVPMSLDATFKDSGRWNMKELCMYEVKDNKIQKAQFFYEIPAMPN